MVPALIVWDWGWQRPGVVPAMPGHFRAYYTDKSIRTEAPLGDVILEECKRKSPHCFPKQCGDSLLD